MAQQGHWRFCHKCNAMFFNGFPAKGLCAAGGGHEAQGFNFLLPHDVPENPKAQAHWRFCHKCSDMFFDGLPNKGKCKAGGGHAAQGFNFVLPHDVPATVTAQHSWRFCHKCNAMFFNGLPSKGSCPAGGPHDAQGFDFVLPHVDPDTATFDSGPVTSSLPLGGSVHLVLRRNGDFTFSSHAHDSGFDNIDYVISAVLVTATGIGFTFQHAGHVEGTSAGLPFGTPKRDSDFTKTGHNPMITREFDGILSGARLLTTLNGKDKLVGGITGMLSDLASQAAQAVGKAALSAAVALVAA
jgi:hypothetical protein